MSGLQLHPYQADCLAKAVANNTIVCLPTGYGKTLVAAKLIEHYLRRESAKNVAFLVPTRPLVDQQADYCQKHCSLDNDRVPLVEKLVGEEQATWDQLVWNRCLKENHILLGTPAVFERLLITDRFASLDQFSLLVFDECHNAVGNSPMAKVLRDAFAPCVVKSASNPRILGLTASFVHGSLNHIEKKRKKLEALMNANIFCPVVPPRPQPVSGKFHQVLWKSDEIFEKQKPLLAGKIEEILMVPRLKEVRKVANACSHVLEELGSNCLKFYLQRVVINQLSTKALMLLEHSDPATVAYGKSVLTQVPVVERQVNLTMKALVASPIFTEYDSQKLEELLKLLSHKFDVGGNGYRGIVFVEQACLVEALSDRINQYFGLKQVPVKSGAVAGSGHQSEADRKSRLDYFRLGAIRLLVSTATLEEGIDVSDCALVVRYTHVTTTKAHIQGSGRARSPEAEIYYFNNDPVVEISLEQRMINVARDTSLALTTTELRSSVSMLALRVDHRHPYPFGDDSGNTGIVDVFNCKQLLNHYCSSMLRINLSPKKDLYRYHRHAKSIETIQSVRYPTPSGWQEVTALDAHEFWRGVETSLVFREEDSSKRKSSTKIAELQIVYLVVVQLREQGLIDLNNHPVLTNRMEAIMNCTLNDGTSVIPISLRTSNFNARQGH